MSLFPRVLLRGNKLSPRKVVGDGQRALLLIFEGGGTNERARCQNACSQENRGLVSVYENASVPCTTAHLFLPIVKRKRRNSCSQENGGLVSMYNEKRKCERTLYDRPSVPPHCEKEKTRRARPSSLCRVERERARRGKTSSLCHVEKEGMSPHCVRKAR